MDDITPWADLITKGGTALALFAFLLHKHQQSLLGLRHGQRQIHKNIQILFKHLEIEHKLIPLQTAAEEAEEDNDNLES